MRRKESEERVTLKVGEAALIAGCGERKLRELIAAGHIPHLRFGRNIRISRAAFLRWIENAGK